MLSSLSFYERDCKNIIPPAPLKIIAYFKVIAPICHVQWILINEKDLYGFCYGSGTIEFLNIPSVKVKTWHGNTFPKVFPLYHLTQTTLLTFFQGKEAADLHNTILLFKKSISPTFLIPDGILSAGTSEGVRIRSH